MVSSSPLSSCCSCPAWRCSASLAGRQAVGCQGGECPRPPVGLSGTNRRTGGEDRRKDSAGPGDGRWTDDLDGSGDEGGEEKKVEGGRN